MNECMHACMRGGAGLLRVGRKGCNRTVCVCGGGGGGGVNLPKDLGVVLGIPSILREGGRAPTQLPAPNPEGTGVGGALEEARTAVDRPGIDDVDPPGADESGGTQAEESLAELSVPTLPVDLVNDAGAKEDCDMVEWLRR